MRYKDPKAYKSFEASWHALKMNIKMHIYIFLICAFFHVLLAGAYIIYKYGYVFSTIAEYVFRKIITFNTIDFERVSFCLKIVLREFWYILFYTLPVWFLYPILISIFRKKSKSLMRDKHVRGTRLMEIGELKRELKKKVSQDSIPIGKVRMPTDYEVQHVFICGRAGSGKTTLLNQVLDKLRERKAKVIIHDMKADYLTRFYDPLKDLIFNPVDERTIGWTVTNEIQTLADIESISHSLIPPGYGQDRFWTDAARDVFFSILFYAYMQDQRKNRDIWEYCGLTVSELLDVMRKAVADGYTECRKAIGYLESESRTAIANDTFATMKQYTNCFMYLKDCDGDFSIRDWIQSEEGGFLFIVNYRNLKDLLRPILSLMVDLASKNTLSLPEDFNRRIFFILDEFAQLQRLPAVVELLEAGRSKGTSVWIATQDINQINTRYNPDVTNTIINNCGTTIAFATGDPQSQEYLSKLFGEREILETDETIGMGSSDMRDGLSIARRRKMEKLILPSEFGSLPKLEFFLKMLEHNIVRESMVFRVLESKCQPLILKKNLLLSERIQENTLIAI